MSYTFLNPDRTIVLRDDVLIAWSPQDNRPLNSDEGRKWENAGSPSPVIYSPTPSVPWVPPPPPIPALSRRQFYQVLALQGLITEEEALQAVQHGTIPHAFEMMLEALPQAEQFSARMLLSGASEFQRDHPLVDAFGQAHGMTAEQIDELWRRGQSV